MPLVASRGALTFGSVAYDFLRDTRALIEGGGWAALTPYEPIGYDLLLAPLVFAGLDPMVAGAAISLAASIASVFIIRAILRDEIDNPGLVALGVLTIILHEKLVTYATQVWAEGAYITTILGALWTYGRLSRRRFSPGSPWSAAGFAMAIAAPIYFSFSGLVVTMCVCLGLVLGAWRNRSVADGSPRPRAWGIPVVIAGVALLMLPALLRNLSLIGTVSGYPDLKAQYSFGAAALELVRQIGLDAVGIPFRVAERLAQLAPLPFIGLVATGLVILLMITPRRPVPLMVATTVAGYFVWFAYFESTSRLDIIGTRIVYPLVPLIALLLLLAVSRGGTRSHRIPAILAGALLAVCVAAGIYKTGRGWRGDHQERIFGYSPATIEATRALLRQSPGTGIAVNRYGSQILAYSSRINIALIPYIDHLNGSYMESFGVRSWTEQEARAHFRQHRIEWLVFFEGPSRTDPYVVAGSYGEFIGRIRRAPIAGELRRTETADGLLVQVDPATW